MTSGFSMRAMTRSLPPHLGQVSMSMAKTRFRRRIQVMGARGLSGFSWRGWRFGTTDSRCLQFGANTPWNRVRFNRGRGTNAAGRAMKSSGSRTTWVDPSRNGCLNRASRKHRPLHRTSRPLFQLQAFLREALPDHNFTSGQFLSGFNSRIMQANDDMFAIAALIKAQPALYEVVIATPARRLMTVLRQRNDTGEVLEAIDTYLATYGHQGYSLDVGEPTQQEAPSAMFVTLKNMVQRADYDPAKHEAEATRKREKGPREDPRTAGAVRVLAVPLSDVVRLPVLPHARGVRLCARHGLARAAAYCGRVGATAGGRRYPERAG